MVLVVKVEMTQMVKNKTIIGLKLGYYIIRLAV